MTRNKLLCRGQVWKLALIVIVVSKFVPICDVLAQGQDAIVKVTFESSDFNDGCEDWQGVPLPDPSIGGCPEYYFRVNIDGVWIRSEGVISGGSICAWPIDPQIELSRDDVDTSKRYIPIVIEQWDDDSEYLDDWDQIDDQCDIFLGPGNAINLTLDLNTCQISGGVSGVCGTSIQSKNVEFSITWDDPPHAGGLSVRCLHDPIWPQPGDQVTITAEALDGTALAKGGVIDDIEIWVDDTNTPVANTASTPGSFGVNTFTFNHNPDANADQFQYRCRVSDDGEEVSSGWRIAQIGNPPQSWIRSVPILHTGPMDSRQDIVFIADEDDYTGANDAQFITDVHSVIRDAYYSSGIGNRGLPFLFNQNLINFWIALDQGNAVDFNSGDNHELPNGWGGHYHFADAGAIVHTQILRDFAMRGDRIFSSEPTSLGTFLHETGHVPFGLADEYCCDSHYFQPDPHPNIYEDSGHCLADGLSAGVTDACFQITDLPTGNTINWFRLDSDSTRNDDLMLNNLTPQPADERRINWLFDECRSGGC